MKRTFIAIAAMAAAFGCAKQESPVSGGKMIEREFIAGFEEQTKTSVDSDGKVYWSSGDVISYYTASGGTVSSVKVPADCHSTSFTATVGSEDTFIIAAYGGTVSNPQKKSMTVT